MQTIFIQEEETQILKNIKAIRSCISHIKQDPQNFSSSGTASSYISAPNPFFARSIHRLFSYLCVYLPAHWKMQDFRKLVSKQHQQVNSEPALKRGLICRVTTQSGHWPAKKTSHISFLSFSIPTILWDWTGIWGVNQGGGRLIQICLSKILELKVIGHLFLLRSPELFIRYFITSICLRLDHLINFQFLILFFSDVLLSLITEEGCCGNFF